MLYLHGHSYLLPTSQMRAPAEVGKQRILEVKGGWFSTFSPHVLIWEWLLWKSGTSLQLKIIQNHFSVWLLCVLLRSFPHMHELSGCTVTCNVLLLLGACRSLAIVVWPHGWGSSLQGFEEECVSSLFPFRSWIGSPSNQTLAFFTIKIHVAIRLCTTNTATPHTPALLRSAQLSGEWRCIEASCIKLSLSGQRRRGTVGASPVLTQSVCSSNWC